MLTVLVLKPKNTKSTGLGRSLTLRRRGSKVNVSGYYYMESIIVIHHVCSTTFSFPLITISSRCCWSDYAQVLFVWWYRKHGIKNGIKRITYVNILIVIYYLKAFEPYCTGNYVFVMCFLVPWVFSFSDVTVYTEDIGNDLSNTGPFSLLKVLSGTLGCVETHWDAWVHLGTFADVRLHSRILWYIEAHPDSEWLKIPFSIMVTTFVKIIMWRERSHSFAVVIFFWWSNIHGKLPITKY